VLPRFGLLGKRGGERPKRKTTRRASTGRVAFQKAILSEFAEQLFNEIHIVDPDFEVV
jgi:hypothetical protein